jgi:hypothetical protein
LTSDFSLIYLGIVVHKKQGLDTALLLPDK